jgi:hypothetical protein
MIAAGALVMRGSIAAYDFTTLYAPFATLPLGTSG